MRRVLFVSKPVVPPFHDGTKCLVRDVGLQLTRYQPILMSTGGRPSPGDSAPECVRPDLQPVYSDVGSFTPSIAENARAAAWLFVRAQADIFHFVFAPNPRTSLVGRLFRRSRRVPVVQTIASAPRRFDPGLFFGDVLVAQSEWTRDRVLGSFRDAGKRAPRVEVVPPPVAELVAPRRERIESVRRALGLDPEARVIVYPGDLETSLGAHRVAEVVPDVWRELPNAVFVFACRHKTPRAALIEATLRCHLSGFPVRFVAEIDLLALYATASAVLFPVDDLFGKVDLPISLLEALRLGVPVLVSAEGPLRGLAGAIQVAPGDGGALVRETLSICRDEERRARVASDGRAAVDRLYDARMVARAYESIYDELLAPGVRAQPKPSPRAGTEGMVTGGSSAAGSASRGCGESAWQVDERSPPMSRTSHEIRQAFLSFFAQNGHEIVSSGPLVPPNDPSLLFANAGMVQFKDVFTGREKRPYKRATTAQKCIRISGKHNDLENVGPSPRHHTFFEMLGNFSFGDYFKEEAIVYAWDFVTRVMDLPKDRLVCTYFKGESGVPADEVARDLWKKVTGFGDDRILGLGMADNFWQMGDTGPCGPSSEIHIYNGAPADPSTFGAEQTSGGVGWMEIWNLVFMQFERDASGQLHPLPAPSIDTGAGLERLACLAQGKLNNYDTDLLRALVDRAATISGKRYGGTMDPDDVSMRVIADHARTTAFLLSEGILPDRTGREYVLRRVMRRAIRHGHRLGIGRPFLHEVAMTVVDTMGDQYPELEERRDHIASVTLQEEERFRQTIERGLGLLEERFERMRAESQVVLPGADAFQLYDTYGFPLDLTQVICAERGFSVDDAGYEKALEEARQRSEWKGVEAAVEGVYRDVLGKIGAGSVRFIGYDADEDRSTVAAIIRGGENVGSAGEGDTVEIVAPRTPFYGEAGGQVGDHGVIETETGGVEVTDTQKPLPGLIVHSGRVTRGTVSVSQAARLAVNVHLREATRRNHSATHLLHLALRKVLGTHVQQKGSLVGPDRLRFDFTHGRPMTQEEIAKVEDLVNERIMANAPVHTEVLPIEAAKDRGAMMIFEEKYGDVVRMLTIADSVELCGGTHARATGDIGLFKIVTEQGVAAGVRRILATTGENSLMYLRELEQRLDRAMRAARASGGDLAEKIEKIVAHERSLEKEVQDLQRKLMTGSGSGGIDGLLQGARDVAGVKVLGLRTELTDRGALRELAEKLRDRLGESVVLIGSEAEGRAQLVLTVSKALSARYKAGELIRDIAAIVGGSGGGRPDMAQAGGTDVTRLDEAVNAVYSRVEAAAAG